MIDPVTGVSDREKHEEQIRRIWLAIQQLNHKLQKLENKKAPRKPKKATNV